MPVRTRSATSSTTEQPRKKKKTVAPTTERRTSSKKTNANTRKKAAPPRAKPMARALENTDIVACIIKKLDTKGLLACRTLNKLWEQLTHENLKQLPHERLLVKQLPHERPVWVPEAKEYFKGAPFESLIGCKSCIQDDLLHGFAITPAKLKGYDKTIRKRHGGGSYYVFKLPETALLILNDHGGLPGVRKRMISRAKRSKSAKEARTNVHKSRTEEIVEALANVGCELRADSKLCANYISSGHGDPAEIADTMARMKYLHEYTKYQKELDKMVQNSDYMYPGIYAECAAELQARYTYPSRWPWL